MRIGLAALVLIAGSAVAQQDGAGPLPLGRSRLEDVQAGTAGTVSAGRTVPALAVKLIKEFESWKPDGYDDPAGYCTIGYGHLIRLQRCSPGDLAAFNPPISVEVGEGLLTKDTGTAVDAVRRLVVVPLDDNQFGALVSFTFNVGKGNFERSSLRRFLNAGRFDLAAQEFGRWVVAGGTFFRGLQRRRACERMLFAGQLRPTASGRVDPDSCTSLGIAPDTSMLIDINVGEF